jgi:uncharacterized protein YjbI with pentapeptide repeats
MPNEDRPLTPDELRARWETPIGGFFRSHILHQLEHKHRIDFGNLAFEPSREKIIDWTEFEGVQELGEPFFDLRGINFENKILPQAKFSKVHLEYANLSDTNLEKASFSLAHLEHADLSLANLEKARMYRAHLEHADLSAAILEKANLYGTHFNHATMSGTNLNHSLLPNAFFKHAILNFAEFENANLTNVNFKHADLTGAKFNNAKLAGASFRFKSFWWFLKKLFSKSKNLKADTPTVLTGAELQKVKLDLDPILFRKLLDEQYLDKFAENHKWLYPFWLLSSNCGRWTSLVFGWAFVLALLFGIIYSQCNFIYFSELTYHDWWHPYYFSFVTMTTLGMSSVEPVSGWAAFWHTVENVIGFWLLGYAIAVLGSKFTRRSA